MLINTIDDGKRTGFLKQSVKLHAIWETDIFSVSDVKSSFVYSGADIG